MSELCAADAFDKGGHLEDLGHLPESAGMVVKGNQRIVTDGPYAEAKDLLEEIRSITDCNRLAAYPFYSAAVGELGLRRGRHDTARDHFRAALALARNPMERRFLDRRLGACEPGDTQPAYYETILGNSFRSRGPNLRS
jgi:hypothetical protein